MLSIPVSSDLEGYQYCIPTPTPVCAPDPDPGGMRKAGHVSFVSRISEATGSFPAEQLLCAEDLVG